MTAIGYVRVSTAEQAESGYGLDVQRAAVETHCAAQGWSLAATYDDAGVSGAASLEHRPGLAAALAASEANPGGQLVVYRLDRLARDLVLQELLVQRLSRHNTAVVSASEPDLDTLGSDPTKVLIRQILGALAGYERALIRGRLDAGRAVKAAAGGYVGGAPPYGYSVVGGALLERAEEQAVIALAAKLRSQGRSLREICADLEEAGFLPRSAVRLSPATLRGILLRAATSAAAG